VSLHKLFFNEYFNLTELLKSFIALEQLRSFDIKQPLIFSLDFNSL
jgi:hypothetical protein